MKLLWCEQLQLLFISSSYICIVI